jgi:3',5'-cyclic-AMP phosphodiesterase
MIIAQISDLHIKAPGRIAYGIVDTASYLERAVARLASLDPRADFVIASGDLVDGGRPEEYARLRNLLAPLPMPYYLVMGNHDERSALRAAFADHPHLREGGEYVHYVIDGAVRVVVADSTMPGEDSGYLDDERLEWIDAALGVDASRPVMLVLHHPPFTTGFQGMDSPPFRNADALAAIVRRHPHLDRIICGHLHRPIVVRWNGALAMTVPSTAHQLTFNLREAAPVTFSLEPPALTLHVYDGAAIATHTVAIDEAPGPYPFRDGGTLIE